MKTLLEPCSKADQEEKKSQADEYQTDCFLVVGRHFHLVGCNQIQLDTKIQVHSLNGSALMWLVRWTKPLTFVPLILLMVGLRVDSQIDRITGKNFATRSEVLARHGMVCTSVPAATQVGIEILKRGGSAVDAAIAANATLGLMEPVS